MDAYTLKMTVKNAVKEALAENERYGYEWEKPTSKKEEENIRKGHIRRLQEEIKRISNVTLRADWGKDLEGRKLWEDRLKKANSELLYWEEEDRKSRK
jgi:hypothetical protein